ncbi:MAG TPA: lipoyl domain-containing protein [Candidatus Dormibacteraeota bacterium]|nr:lipoyl domain-containing protein [Candidatus Dormibacteraeota bacterium]
MAVDIVVPDELWNGVADGVITTWLADDGAAVRHGDLIAEFMLLKATLEIRAPADGRLRTLKAANEVVHRGDVLGRIE